MDRLQGILIHVHLLNLFYCISDWEVVRTLVRGSWVGCVSIVFRRGVLAPLMCWVCGVAHTQNGNVYILDWIMWIK